jgi:predicted SAM-dependent methyltransferase
MGRYTKLRLQFRKKYFARAKKARAAAELRNYLNENESPKLNVGCGGNYVEGWFNVDINPDRRTSYLDATDVWPYMNNTFDLVLCEHMIEHVHKLLGRHLLRETFRVLKPGGAFRVVTPDLDTLAELIVNPASRVGKEGYLDAQKGFFNQPDMTWCDVVNRAFYSHGHRYIFSVEELTHELEDIGFTDLVIGRAGYPTNPAFEGVEGHIQMWGREVNAIDAFSIEAVKPL